MSASKNESTKKEDDDVPSVVDINRSNYTFKSLNS